MVVYRARKQRMEKMKQHICLWTILCSSGMVFGQLPTDSVPLRHRALREVTVVENRRQQSMSSTVPQHLVDRQDMLLMGITDMGDALHRLPGITLRDYGGAGGMKTVSVRGFGAKHTGVSYDGVMLSDTYTGEIDLSRYSLTDVEHLMLTVGDNADIFVSARQASTPAVLSIKTLSVSMGSSRPRLSAQLQTGSFGYIRPYLRYEQSPTKALALSATTEYTYANNDYPYTIQNVTEQVSDRRKNSRMNSVHSELNMLWQHSATTSMRAKLYYYDNDRQLPGLVHYYSNISRETLRDRNLMGQLQLQKHWAENLSLRLTAKWNWAASFYDDGITASQIQDANYYQREGYASASLLYTPSQKWAVDYSADYVHQNMNSTLPMDARPHRHGILQSLTGKYTAGRTTVTARLLHSLYLNDTQQGESARNVSRLSPSVSMSLGLTPNLQLRASLKEIFRVPTFNESYFFHYGSPTLQPERTQQINLGLTWHTAMNDRGYILATVDAYYNKVHDMIVSVPYNMFVWTCVNIGRVSTLGLDATLRASLPVDHNHRLTATASFTYQRAQNRTNEQSPNYGKQIAYTPEYTASAAAAWENPWVSLSWHIVGVSHRWTTNEHLPETRVDGYADMGITAYHHWRLGGTTVEPRLDIKNITDSQYEIVGGYPMPGISYQLSVNIKY